LSTSSGTVKCQASVLCWRSSLRRSRAIPHRASRARSRFQNPARLPAANHAPCQSGPGSSRNVGRGRCEPVRHSRQRNPASGRRYHLTLDPPARMLLIKLDVRREPRRITADDSHHQVHVMTDGRNHSFQAAADTGPSLQPPAGDRRIDRLVFEWRTPVAAVGDHVLRHDLREQVESHFKQFLISRKIVAEEREGFDEGPSPGNDLRAPVSTCINRREPLKHTDRIVGT
jgi:hypothetical protein